MADDSLRLPALKAAHAVDNPASGKVLAKLGFRPNGDGTLPSLSRHGEMPVRFFARARSGVAQKLAA